MNRYWIIAFMAGALALIGLATVPAIQAALPRSEALAAVDLAPPRAAGFSGPRHTWSAYQPIEGISAATGGAAEAPVNLAPPQARGFSGPLHTWSAYQPIEGISSAAAPDGSYQR